jgi:signal transduction histidine kinase
MEAMPNGGDLIARTSLAGDAVQIDLADTGTGIPPDKAAKVFRPYFTTKKAGTGLGLATVKRIVDDHGGQIHFTSEPGKGTNFTIRLPVRPAASGRQAARSDTR